MSPIAWSPVSLQSVSGPPDAAVSVPAQSVGPLGIASAEAFGAVSIVSGLAVSPFGIASPEAFGSVTVSTGAAPGLSILPVGIAGAEAFGAAGVNLVTSGAGSIAERSISSLAIGEAPQSPSSVPVIVTRSSQQVWYWDNNGKGALTGSVPNQYFKRNGFARLVLQTDDLFDGSITIGAVPTGTSQPDSALSIRVDGGFNQTVNYDIGSLGVNQLITITVPGGAHTIEIWDGSNAGATKGCAVTSLRFRGGVVLPTRPTRRLAAYGDSLTAGNFGDPRSVGWLMSLRNSSRFDGVINLGQAGLAAWNQMLTAPLRSAFVTELASACDGTVENVPLILLGTNDYINSLWTAAAYVTAFGQVADLWHAALPGTQLLIGTMFALASTGNNAFGAGNAKADYDAMPTTVAASRSWVTPIDCTNFWSVADLAQGTGDGVIHPGNVGHAKAYAAFNAIL